MRTVLALLVGPALLALAEGVCHKLETEYYTELGCRPEAPDAEGCPTSYDCGLLASRAEDKCHYNGQVYNKDQKLETTPATACLADCRCRKNHNDRVQFLCAHVECPELFNGPPRPGCYRTYEHSRCCHVQEICESSAGTKTSQPTCEYGGKTYKVGEKFYPEEEPCLTCICQQGYNGSFVEPFCQKVHCNLELVQPSRIRDGCIPVYYGEAGCCPITWRCPEKSDSILPAASNAHSKSTPATDKTCQFGELTLKVGERLNADSVETECSCRVPPHPVCVQRPSN